jgi:hypothetical protein
MLIDVASAARELRIVDVWREGNETGIVTSKLLYDTTVPNNHAPLPLPLLGWVNHVTVGVNSLGYLCRPGADKDWACIPFLIPRTNDWTVYKLIPPGARCNHAGVAEFRGVTSWNARSWGAEVENRADGSEPITERQYVKLALLYANFAAANKTDDQWCVSHSLIAVPHGRRSDPEAGGFRASVFWDLVQQVRRQWPWESPHVWWGGGYAG